jgi:small subunit ribosomal protein S2
MKNITLEELLEAGCHFGHQVARSNPKARDFIFEARDGIHIIDLAKTKDGLESAGKFLKSFSQDPSVNMVIVGTKRQTQEILKSELERVKTEITGDSGLYFVTNKWIGGLLTNFSEVSKNFKKLQDYIHKLETPSEQEGYTKKEIGGWGKEKEKLERLYGGVYTLTKKPDILFIIDAKLESLAVKEASRMNVPTVAIVDTNADPALVNYPIPANDDAVGSLGLIIGYVLDAWKEGKNSIKIEKPKAEQKVEAKTTSANSSPQELVAQALKEEAAKKQQEVGIKNQEKTKKNPVKKVEKTEKLKAKKETKIKKTN